MSKEVLNKIISKAREYRVKKVFLFGSSVQGEDYRDIDIACSGLNGWNVFRFAGELENELGVNVDVVSLDKESDFVTMIKPKLKLIYEG